MKKIIKVLLVNLIFLVFFLEIISFVLIKINILPNGLPPNLTLSAHEKFSYWHPKNSKFKIATKCWDSEVEFNNIGIKSNKNLKVLKSKKRIAIMGDSMTENTQLSNNNDFAHHLQNLFPEYEVINFSVSSVGLADQIKIYNNLVNQYDVDYIFLYLTFNDFSDNHVSQFRSSREAFDVINNEVVNVNKDKSLFFEHYNSNWNTFKREKLIFVKKYFNSFKLYYYLKWNVIRLYQQNKSKKTKVENNFLEEKRKVFSYIVDQAKLDIFSKVKTLIFINSYNFDFTKKEIGIVAMKEILSNYNVFDPQKEFTEYLKKNNILKKPYLGYSCDAHYSLLGVKLLSDYTFKKFVEFQNSDIVK